MNVLKEVLQVIKDTKRLLFISWLHHKGLMLAALFVVSLVSTMPFLQSFFMGELLTSLAKKGSVENLLIVSVIFSGLIFAVSNILQFFFKTILYKKLFAEFAVLIHRKIADLDVPSHENPSRKNLITKVQENAMWRAPEFVQRIVYLGQNLLEVLIASFVVFGANIWLGLGVAVSALPRLVIDLKYNHELWKVETSLAETRRRFWHTRWFMINLNALKEVKLFQNIPFFIGEMKNQLEEVNCSEIAVEKKTLFYQLASLLTSELVQAIAIIFLVNEVLNNRIEVGTLVFYLTSLATFRLSLNTLSQNIGSQFQDAKFVRDMFAVFDLEPMLPISKCTKAKEIEQIENIIFEDVQFSYPGSDRQVLKDINLEINGGETLGIVAENGSGKTTLSKLLCKEYVPTRGRILVNGIDLQDINTEYWLSLIGVMTQSFCHYEHLDVCTAIKIGKINCFNSGESQIIKAAECADLYTTIKDLPKGYQTIIGSTFKGGVELSGGQYQKFAVSRIFYRDPLLAILDEPTSAIDGEAEARIFNNLLQELSCTKVLITHRFYTIRKAHKICVLEDGIVGELGTHQELMEQQGLYCKRYKQQQREYL